jgi:hypothetical protein
MHKSYCLNYKQRLAPFYEEYQVYDDEIRFFGQPWFWSASSEVRLKWYIYRQCGAGRTYSQGIRQDESKVSQGDRQVQILQSRARAHDCGPRMDVHQQNRMKMLTTPYWIFLKRNGNKFVTTIIKLKSVATCIGKNDLVYTELYSAKRPKHISPSLPAPSR